jgi:hypothetical protein
METLKLTDLRPHPANASIYGDGADAGFIENVKKVGILTPLLVTSDGRIISGHRRWRAAQECGLETVPTLPFGSTDEDDIVEALVLSNRDSRKRTNEQIGREMRVLEEIAARRQKKKPGSVSKQKDSEKINIYTVDINAAAAPRRSMGCMEIAAAQVGVDKMTAYRLVDSVNAIDHLTAQNKTADAHAVRAALEQSASKGQQVAHQLAPESVKRRQVRTKRPLAELEKDLHKPRTLRKKGNYEKAVYYFDRLKYDDMHRFGEYVRVRLSKPKPKSVPPAPPGTPKFIVPGQHGGETVH